MARRKLPGGIWEDLVDGTRCPPGQPSMPPPRLASRCGRPRALTADLRTRARRVAANQRAPLDRRVALAVLEHESVSSAAEALGMAPHQVYEVLRTRS